MKDTSVHDMKAYSEANLLSALRQLSRDDKKIQRLNERRTQLSDDLEKRLRERDEKAGSLTSRENELIDLRNQQLDEIDQKIETYNHAVPKQTLSDIVDDLEQRYLSEQRFKLYHAVGNFDENISKILTDGALKSYRLLEKENDIVSGNHTITEDGLSDFCNLIFQEADPDFTQDRVFFRLLKLENPETAQGFYIDLDDIPDDAWMNFEDPGEITRHKIDQALAEGHSHNRHSGFSFSDVYMSDDIKPAIIFRALHYCVQIQEYYKNCQTDDEIWGPSYTNSRDEVFESLSQLDARSRRESLSNLGPDEFVPLSLEYINSKSFHEDFKTSLAMVFEDLKDLGQVTLPHSVDIKSARLTVKDESKTVKDWQSQEKNRHHSSIDQPYLPSPGQ